MRHVLVPTVNSGTIYSCFFNHQWCLLACHQFEDRFCTSKKSGIAEMGRFRHKVPCTWRLPWGVKIIVWEQALQERFEPMLGLGSAEGSLACSYM